MRDLDLGLPASASRRRTPTPAGRRRRRSPSPGSATRPGRRGPGSRAGSSPWSTCSATGPACRACLRLRTGASLVDFFAVELGQVAAQPAALHEGLLAVGPDLGDGRLQVDAPLRRGADPGRSAPPPITVVFGAQRRAHVARRGPGRVLRPVVRRASRSRGRSCRRRCCRVKSVGGRAVGLAVNLSLPPSFGALRGQRPVVVEEERARLRARDRPLVERLLEPGLRVAGDGAAGAVVEQDPHLRQGLERREGRGVVRLVLDRVVGQGDALDPERSVVDDRRRRLLRRV